MHEGKEFIPVKGYVVEIEPNKLLSYTVIDPHNPNIPDVPENCSRRLSGRASYRAEVRSSMEPVRILADP